MSFKYTDSQIKKALADILLYDDRIDIHKATGIGYTMLTDNFNPDTERKSHAFILLQIASALADLSEERGDRFMDELRDRYESSKERRGRGCHHIAVGNEMAHIISLASLVLAERADGVEVYEQLVKVQEIGRRLMKVRRALLDEIASEPKGRLTPEKV